jgi:hypothetical protein
MADEPEIPPFAAWFRLEKQTEAGDWQECSAGKQKYWRVGSVDPNSLAIHVGPGVYRTMFTAEDRRRRRTIGVPFEIPEGAGEPQQPAAPESEDEGDPPPHKATEEPPPATPDNPKPPKNRRRKPHRYDMPTMDPAAMAPPEGVTLHPLGQFVYLQSLSEAHGDKFHGLLLEGMRMMVENERARSQEHVANVKAHYEALDKNRADFMAAVMNMTANKPNGQITELAAAVKQLGDQVEDLAEDADHELDPAQLAKLSENPNDLERAMAAVQNVVSVVANSPIGAALAERLREAGAPLPEK